MNGDFIVIFRYDPGTPKTYRVNGAPNQHEARKAALAEIGYNPGVLIHVRDFRKGDTADYIVEYRQAVRA